MMLYHANGAAAPVESLDEQDHGILVEARPADFGFPLPDRQYWDLRDMLLGLEAGPLPPAKWAEARAQTQEIYIPHERIDAVIH